MENSNNCSICNNPATSNDGLYCKSCETKVKSHTSGCILCLGVGEKYGCVACGKFHNDQELICPICYNLGVANNGMGCEECSREL